MCDAKPTRKLKGKRYYQRKARVSKAWRTTRANFESALANLFRNPPQRQDLFASDMLRLLNDYGTLAYQDGLRYGGANGELDDIDRANIASWLSGQRQYVLNVFDDVVLLIGNQLNPFDRAELWLNKSLVPMYQAGMENADRKQREADPLLPLFPLPFVVEDDEYYEWRMGNTEHCDDCLRLNGQIHTMREWMDSGWLPQADTLDCGGWNCQCRLIRRPDATRGRGTF